MLRITRLWFVNLIACGIAMHITVSLPSTGFIYAPGLARPVVIDVAQLPAVEAQKFETLVGNARLFDKPDLIELNSLAETRDAKQYEIIVEKEGKKRILRVWEPVESIGDVALREFIAYARDYAQQQRRRLNK
jgi:Emfourin